MGKAIFHIPITTAGKYYLSKRVDDILYNLKYCNSDDKHYAAGSPRGEEYCIDTNKETYFFKEKSISR